jgi:threonine/homoserine/homoserine lactone efflux protein
MPIDPGQLALFLAATLALVVTPGPVVLYVVARSMSQGPRAGLASVLGAELGNSVHVAAAALGLAALLASSALAFSIVKYLGAAYLVFLGVRKLAGRDGHGPEGSRNAPRQSLRSVFAQGVVVAVLNPKTALFFLAFLPQFVDPTRGSPTAQILTLGALMVGIAIVSDSAYALLAGSVGRWLWRSPRFVRSERYVSGTVYIGLGALAAFSGTGRGSASATHG